jgi:hypothetical protein
VSQEADATFNKTRTIPTGREHEGVTYKGEEMMKVMKSWCES